MKLFLATALCSLTATSVNAFAPHTMGSSFVGGVRSYGRDLSGKYKVKFKQNVFNQDKLLECLLTRYIYYRTF